MFKGMKFTFLEIGLELSSKRAQILAELVIKHEGAIIEKNKISADNLPDIVITSKAYKYENLCEKYSEEIANDLIEKCTHPEYVGACIKEKKKLDSRLFKINICKSNNNKRRVSSIASREEEEERSKRGKVGTAFYAVQESETNLEESIYSLPSSKKSLHRGKRNSRKLALPSQEEEFISNEITNKSEESTNLHVISTLSTNQEPKTNKEIFQEIQDMVINLKKQGKDDGIFSDEDNKSTISDISTSSTFSQSPSSSFELKTPYRKFIPDASKYAFSSGSSHENLNEHITSELESILNYHTNENNVFEALAYRKAISQIKGAKEKITSCDQLKKYKHLGVTISKRIKEILLTGKSLKGEYVRNEEKNKIIKQLCGVWGIGMTLANKLYINGIRTIEDLRNNQHLLNHSIKVGLKYYEDMQKRIPREEVEKIFEIINEELWQILPAEILESKICGSYRRGKETCGDIDVILTRKDDGGINGILQTLIDKLIKRGLVVEVFALSGNNRQDKNQFMGICKFQENPNRRLDVKIYPKERFPFAVLYFTGSPYFNRSMRLFAKRLGYHLSDMELKVIGGSSIHCESEEEIFAALGIEYKAPNERDI